MPSERLRTRLCAALALAAVLSAPAVAATFRYPGGDPETSRGVRQTFTLVMPTPGTLFVELGDLAEPAATRLAIVTSDPGVEALVIGPRAVRVTANRPASLRLEVASLEAGRPLPAFSLRTFLGPHRERAVRADVDPWDDDLGGKPKPPPPPPPPVVLEEVPEAIRVGTTDDGGDTFTFHLPAPAALESTARGETWLRLTLIDEGGRVLTTAESTGEPARLTRQLPAGRYLLRVESRHHDKGAYALTLRTLTEP